MKRIPRAETLLALVAAVLAAVASLYLVVTLYAQHEVCYGIRARALLCTHLTPQSFPLTAARTVVVLGTLALLYGGALIGAWFHERAREPSARGAALGLLCTCAVLLLTLTAPAIGGPGFFLIPSTLLMLVAAGLGLYAQIQSGRAAPPDALGN